MKSVRMNTKIKRHSGALSVILTIDLNSFIVIVALVTALVTAAAPIATPKSCLFSQSMEQPNPSITALGNASAASSNAMLASTTDRY